MTKSKSRAKIHDILIKTGPGSDDFEYSPLDKVPLNGQPIGEVVDSIRESQKAFAENTKEQITTLKETNEKLSQELARTRESLKKAIERLDKQEAAFTTNIKEWLTK